MNGTETMAVLEPLAIFRCPTVEQAVSGVDGPYSEAQDDFIGEGQSAAVSRSEQEGPKNRDGWGIEAKKVPPQPPGNRLGHRGLGTNRAGGRAREGISGKSVRVQGRRVQSISGGGEGRSYRHAGHGVVEAKVLRRMLQDFPRARRCLLGRSRSVVA